MPTPPWMLYGASGFTGRLLLEEALRRGHRPILGGRNRAKLEPLAAQHGLEAIAVDLNDRAALEAALARVKLVFHAAGPFAETSAPMRAACLGAGAHYLDITGELSVFRSFFEPASLDSEARARGIAMVPGVGFDVVPSDCLALYLAEKIPDATHLEIVVGGVAKISAGTAKTMVSLLPFGNVTREAGALVPQPFGLSRKVNFRGRERHFLVMPLGDLETAFHSTHIANITTYVQAPRAARTLVRLVGPLVARALRHDRLRRALENFVARRATGPDASLRASEKSRVWARVANGRGEVAEAWLECAEPYQFTAQSGVLAVEAVFAKGLKGVLSPAAAFGADFVLAVPGTRRHDLQEPPAMQEPLAPRRLVEKRA